MTDELINTYTLKISQANASALAVIALELEIIWIEEGLTHLQNNDVDAFIRMIDKAQKAQQELMATMDLSNEVAFHAFEIFTFINQQLILSKIKRIDMELARCVKILEKLKNSFSIIAEADDSPPLIANSEKVYAGLTYGKGKLNENTLRSIGISI